MRGTEMTADDGIVHTLWLIDSDTAIADITACLRVPSFNALSWVSR